MFNYCFFITLILGHLLTSSHGLWIGHEDAGDPMYKRYEMNERGFAGDSLSGGFGTFSTMKKRGLARDNILEKKLDYIIEILNRKS